MECNRFVDEIEDFVACLCRSHATGQVRNIRAIACITLFDDNQVLHHETSHFTVYDFNPACFRILLSVPGGRSALVLPATVTSPGLDGCLYCRWLPRVRTSCQPSASRRLIMSPTFKQRV